MKRSPLLYEINTRSWLAELSAQAGEPVTLANVPEAQFEFWLRCGFTHIWLMGVWSTGEAGLAHSRREVSKVKESLPQEQIIGSPYAITGYNVSEKLGGDQGLAKFRERLSAAGISLILDFIPNHTAIDHPWVREHPDFYVTVDHEQPHTIQPDKNVPRWFAHGHSGVDTPWVDTLQLDYRNPALRCAMVNEFLSVSRKCDGVRCDMAMLELNDVFARTWREFPNPYPAIETEFWTDAIRTVRRERPDFMFVAEVYWGLETRLQELGFDFTYDKGLYDRMVTRRGKEVVNYLYSRSESFIARSIHFIENHDEPRIASLLSQKENQAAALLMMSLPGMRLLHEGQLEGMREHASIHVETRKLEEPDNSIASFYEKLFRALRDTAIGSGKARLLRAQAAWADSPTHEYVALIQWQKESRAFELVVINFSDVQSQCYTPLEIKDLAQSRWRFADLLGHEIHERDGAELAKPGLYLDVAPQAAQLFHFEMI